MPFKPCLRLITVEPISETDPLPVASQAFLFGDRVAGGKKQTDADDGKDGKQTQHNKPVK
jgi:hypothetical protein